MTESKGRAGSLHGVFHPKPLPFLSAPLLSSLNTGKAEGGVQVGDQELSLRSEMLSGMARLS